MGRLVMALGVLLGIGVAADYFMVDGSNRVYLLEFVMDGGKLAVKKTPPPPYVVGSRHRTRMAFVNHTTDNVEFQLDEDHACHFTYKSSFFAKACKSGPVKLKRGDDMDLIVKVHEWNEQDCIQAGCPTVLRAKLSADLTFKEIDPDLQIERDSGLLPDWLRALLFALAVVSVAAPPLRAYFMRRRARRAN